MNEKSHQVAELLRQISQLRQSTLAISGWSWRAAGYHFDPDQHTHDRIEKLGRDLDRALALPDGPQDPDR